MESEILRVIDLVARELSKESNFHGHIWMLVMYFDHTSILVQSSLVDAHSLGLEVTHVHILSEFVCVSSMDVQW